MFVEQAKSVLQRRHAGAHAEQTRHLTRRTVRIGEQHSYRVRVQPADQVDGENRAAESDDQREAKTDKAHCAVSTRLIRCVTQHLQVIERLELPRINDFTLFVIETDRITQVAALGDVWLANVPEHIRLRLAKMY